MEMPLRGSAVPEDGSHAGALQVLATALCSKPPSAWKLYELNLFLQLRGEVDARGKKAELAERLVWSYFFVHTCKPEI